MEYTFISYSRKQLYFAEAIALHLQKEGIEIWFDLQQLGAGTDWASTLKNGYEKCTRLVLVVSQSALASKYVEVEWDTARQNGREVILAVIEDVTLPEKLRDCAIIDFRTNFKSAIKRLASYLNGKLSRPTDRISAQGKFPYSLHLPLPIWFAIISLMWPYVWMLALTLSTLKQFPNQAQPYFIVGSIIMGILIFAAGIDRFWKHNLEHQAVRNLGAIAIIVQMLLMASAAAIQSPLAGAITVSFVLNVYFYLWFTKRSAALLRWYAAGQAPQQLRRHCHARLLGKDAKLGEELLQSQPVDYFLNSDSADQPMAKHVAQILSQAGHRQVTDIGKSQKHLYLISNRTSRKLVEQASKDGMENDIFLLGSSIDWSENLDNAGKTQFVDLREHDANDVKVLASSLSNMDAWRRQYALEATPTKFEAFAAPASVQAYRFLAYLQVASFLSTAILQLYVGAWVAVVVPLLFGIVTFFAVERSLQRKIPALIAFGVLAGLPLLFAALNGQLLVALPNAAIVGAVLYSGRFWFPAFSPLAKDALGMDKDGRSKAWGRVFIIAVIIITVVFNFLKVRPNS
ncbi:MAG: toll/interleukin-1 receptor domain-containing protein [Anaerolineales bacterium]